MLKLQHPVVLEDLDRSLFNPLNLELKIKLFQAKTLNTIVVPLF
jgi:hypothetical protein